MNLLNLIVGKRLFIGTVVVPSALAALYFGAVASDVYVSESRFVIRSAEKSVAGAGIGELFKGLASAGSENVLLVRDYLLARELMELMDRRFHLRDLYRRGDFAARFPGPWQQPSLEEFAAYYQDHVHVEVDASSYVGVLTVQAFDPRSACDINQALLTEAQERIARLNADIRKDTQDVADRELARAKARLTAADQALAGFRLARGLVDPERQAALELQGAQDLAAKLVAARARLDQVRKLAPLSPQVASVQAEVSTMEQATAQVRATVAGAATDSRVLAARDFQALELERELASRNIAAAQEAQVRARLDAERKHLYLETVSVPNVPDGALHPKRLRSFAATVLLSFAVFAVLSLVGTGVREHGQLV